MTGGGHGKTFADIRDHALIRVLTEGLRRTEVTEMRMTDLPLDLVSQRLIRVVPLKGARAEEEGRVVLIAPGHRPSHRRLPAEPPLSPPGGLAVRLAGAAERRAARRDGPVPDAAEAGREAGYEPAVHPHMFRHTFANDWLLAAALRAT